VEQDEHRSYGEEERYASPEPTSAAREEKQILRFAQDDMSF
jgi:hypothetical protein